MPLPSYLQRRDGGRYHFQMRLPKALATCLGWSHLRCALRTTDSREARRRMLTMLDWIYEFRDAPDLEAAGQALTRKLETFVVAGPPATARELTDRQAFEGLLDRVARLRAAGETRLFPSRTAHHSKAGEVRWGKSISRAFDYARKLPDVNLTRANLSLYGTRHLMADWLDTLRVPDRVRNRVLGHISAERNSADKYGGKGMLSSAQAGFVTDLETPVIKRMRAILIAAKQQAEAGILTTIEPFASSLRQAEGVDAGTAKQIGRAKRRT